MRLAVAAFVMMSAALWADDGKPSRDINLVLRSHDQELLAIPGVIGVAVGLLPDGLAPCLRLMLAKKVDPAQLPKELEGYPVVSEITGEIHPLQGR